VGVRGQWIFFERLLKNKRAERLTSPLSMTFRAKDEVVFFFLRSLRNACADA
jgi:hypothetical protein